MRAVVKNGIGVFHPQGFLDGNSSSALLSIDASMLKSALLEFPSKNPCG